MLFLFCEGFEDPRRGGEVDSDWQPEAAAVRACGEPVKTVKHDVLVDAGRPADEGLLHIPMGDLDEDVFYRGWMLRSEQYARFYAALAARGARLINTPEQYRHAHELPNNYASIAERTPKTVWIETTEAPSPAALRAALAEFDGGPVVIKDYVKSEKHDWSGACFIPDSGDLSHAQRVVERFFELRGEDVVGGLVIRAFVALEVLGRHPQSDMPLANEHRLFFLDGRCFFQSPYWPELQGQGETPPSDLFADVAARVDSRFFAMDIARQKHGDWIVIELGDGQVSGLPNTDDAPAFYKALREQYRAV